MFAWNEKELINRVSCALDVAEAVFEELVEKDTVLDRERLEAPVDKVVAEVAIFLRTIIKCRNNGITLLQRRAAELARRLAPYARSERLKYGILLHPALALDYGASHIILDNCGIQDTKFDIALDLGLADINETSRERLPYRQLEQAWLLFLRGETLPKPLIAKPSILTHGVDIISSDRDDLYALTHAVMYATDFGREQLFNNLPTKMILSQSEGCLARSMDEDDFDLAAEVIMAWPFLQSDFSTTALFGFYVLRTIDDQAGILPSLSINYKEYSAIPQGAKREYVAAASYHTALVMGLLCSSILNQPYSCYNVTPKSDKNRLKTMRDYLDTHTKHPVWLDIYDDCSPEQQAAADSLLADCCIRRAMLSFDFETVRKFIQLEYARCNTLSMTARQSGLILRRLGEISRIEELNIIRDRKVVY